jgi:hypothetical protein
MNRMLDASLDGLPGPHRRARADRRCRAPAPLGCVFRLSCRPAAEPRRSRSARQSPLLLRAIRERLRRRSREARFGRPAGAQVETASSPRRSSLGRLLPQVPRRTNHPPRRPVARLRYWCHGCWVTTRRSPSACCLTKGGSGPTTSETASKRHKVVLVVDSVGPPRFELVT